MNDLFVDSWGIGTTVVLLDGSLATGAEEWEAQRPLAEQGFRLVVASASCSRLPDAPARPDR